MGGGVPLSVAAEGVVENVTRRRFFYHGKAHVVSQNPKFQFMCHNVIMPLCVPLSLRRCFCTNINCPSKNPFVDVSSCPYCLSPRPPRVSLRCSEY